MNGFNVPVKLPLQEALILFATRAMIRRGHLEYHTVAGDTGGFHRNVLQPFGDPKKRFFHSYEFPIKLKVVRQAGIDPGLQLSLKFFFASIAAKIAKRIVNVEL
jgi:hypothetical protein